MVRAKKQFENERMGGKKRLQNIYNIMTTEIIFLLWLELLLKMVNKTHEIYHRLYPNINFLFNNC